jgi:hypothetical protein
VTFVNLYVNEDDKPEDVKVEEMAYCRYCTQMFFRDPEDKDNPFCPPCWDLLEQKLMEEV